MRRLCVAAAAALVMLVMVAATASAHPLGNYTVNRAVAVTIGADAVRVIYVVDMAEIPAFNEIAVIDADGDGRRSPAEEASYAAGACGAARATLRLTAEKNVLSLATASAPTVSFPIGAGGLRTLRLACTFDANLPAGAGGSLSVRDLADDGHVGWHEVTIAAGAGVRLTQADVPARSESAYLSAYPADRLQTPPDVRAGSAEFVRDGAAGGAAAAPSAPLVAQSASDPLAALVAGELSLPIVALALLLAAGLGAAHAISPGHGKTLVAAYLVGSRGSVRQAAALGITVAATHTAGVLLLGLLVLAGGELFLPERLIGWLTVVSGAVMAILGVGLVLRAVLRRRASAEHEHSHPHPHEHPHPHPHATAGAGVSARSVALLGMAGGMVPSASALIVLLAAVTTGRLVFGLALIAAFGLGMALVLGGIAVVTTLAQGWLSHRLAGGMPPALARAARLLPLGSGLVVAGIGLVLTISAVARLG
ncbi:MAG TPA: sulfite exporter TauE/SafE family protein [Candidatus Limnocylindria bacterium]|nr:sulfite exporter TauE/SafE family protein [Candidatus Limnocylindria bacterium]